MEKHKGKTNDDDVMRRFSRKTTGELKNYVYALVDPQNDEIFYIGKGSNSTRPFAHLGESVNGNNVEKNERIASIRSQGNEPRVEIIRYGLTKGTAHEAEAALIDAIGIKNLTNSIRGHETDRGRATALDLDQQIGGKPIDVENITVKAILFYCHGAYPKYDLYDATRQYWDVSGDRVQEKINGNYKYQYAFAMRGSTVLEVYKILAWYPGGSTVSSRTYQDNGGKCWEFIGSLAEERVRKEYRNKVLHRNGALLHAAQKGYRYLG